MKRLHFIKPNNLSYLHDALLAANPSLRPIPNTAGRLSTIHPRDPITGLVPLEHEAVMVVEGSGDQVWLTVPDTADEVAIAAVVAAHDSLAPRPPSAKEQARTRGRNKLLALGLTNDEIDAL